MRDLSFTILLETLAASRISFQRARCSVDPDLNAMEDIKFLKDCYDDYASQSIATLEKLIGIMIEDGVVDSQWAKEIGLFIEAPEDLE